MENIKKFFSSFGYAFNGFVEILGERNFKFHLLVTILVLIFAFYLQFSSIEFVLLILTIAAVLTAEGFNTAIERLADTVRDEGKLDYSATKIPRDISAFAVLVTSIAAILIGLILFLPKIMALFL